MNLARLYAERICPACGNKLDFEPWADSDFHERPCLCCGLHFGHDDADELHREASYKRWRLLWISYGKRWWRGQPPADFNADDQLKRLERIADEPPEWPGAN